MEALGGVALVAGRHRRDGARLSGSARDLGAVGDQREIANALYNYSFRYAVSETIRGERPGRIGFAQMTRARDLADEDRRRARRGECAVGDRQLAVLPR